MKLYDCRTEPSPRRVRIFIAEKGLDIPRVEVDLRGGEMYRESATVRPGDRAEVLTAVQGG